MLNISTLQIARFQLKTQVKKKEKKKGSVWKGHRD